MEMLTDEMLEHVTGGTEIRYSVESDPLYSKFKTLWDKNKMNEKTNGTGMESRADFLDSFKNWVNNGMPEDINGSLNNKV
ncbi:MAG: hypothetical protein K6E34_08335 [Lachnospiraceae bacterium]|nr:hypothetical protein [Lachnospiraceae bacterium]